VGIFLRAHWRNIAIVSYAVPDEVLTPHLPPGCELDRLNGMAFASLVALEIRDTHVLGVKWPGFADFLQWNLRFYVRKGERRGVVFVRQFVPSRLIAIAARWRYREPFEQAALRQVIASTELRYEVSWRGTSATMALGLTPTPQRADGEREHFFQQRRWGFRDGAAFEVVHPEWEILPVTSVRVDLDWKELYGPEWVCLQNATPYHAMFAVGSEATVSTPVR
jgi:uncharacterized protein YqjF (DUF2071 family)